LVRPQQLIGPRATTLRRLLAAALTALWLAGCAGTAPSTAGGGAPASGGTPQTPATGAEPGPQETPPPVAPRADTSGATLALLQQSERAQASGSVAEAIAYTERAIRISPREPELWIRRASLELADNKPTSAIQYANKAVSLAGNRVDLQRDAWLVIADARDALGQHEEAAAIRERWKTYRG